MNQVSVLIQPVPTNDGPLNGRPNSQTSGSKLDNTGSEKGCYKDKGRNGHTQKDRIQESHHKGKHDNQGHYQPLGYIACLVKRFDKPRDNHVNRGQHQEARKRSPGNVLHQLKVCQVKDEKQDYRSVLWRNTLRSNLENETSMRIIRSERLNSSNSSQQTHYPDHSYRIHCGGDCNRRQHTKPSHDRHKILTVRVFHENILKREPCVLCSNLNLLYVIIGFLRRS